MNIKRALLSVSNKQGIIELAKCLHAAGVEIISTGGTMQAIKQAGIPVTYVSEVTGFPEIMDGRVKTLNPYVHGGILAIRANQEHVQAMQTHGIKPIDMVVVNLYPFKETIAKPGVTKAEAIENIDIGGPAMIRAAAKNFKDVMVVVNPERYAEIIELINSKQEISLNFRQKLSLEAYRHTGEYDLAITKYLLQDLTAEEFVAADSLLLTKVQDLRYGENPHQKAAFYAVQGEEYGIAKAKQLHGKELSFNNIVDLEAAYRIVCEFDKPAVSIIKHTNPCGTATAAQLCTAYLKAYAADSTSAFGGIIALNQIVDQATALEMSKLFVEAIIAPAYSPEALEILTAKKNIRLLELPLLAFTGQEKDMKKVTGGILIQELDTLVVKREDLQVVSKRQPTEAEWADLLFAWKVVKHVKSNAIVLAKAEVTLGVGAGQMNRVGSANIAIAQAGAESVGSVLASDAFLPFRDTVDSAHQAGISAIIQTGGSVRDQESIDAANEHGLAMVFTKVRHFKH